MSSATLWRPERADLRAMLLVALIPILLAIPQLTPWLKGGPLFYTSHATLEHGAIQRGYPYIDPNSGFQTEALGYRAAMDWLEGTVPWWNPYSGIGMPLAGEYQPAAFFPLTFLTLLPRGMVLLQMALQVIAGLGTYALLRQMNVGRRAAMAGGLLYAVNGTLAWFSHGPAGAVPWLPWFLFGIERAWAAARDERARHWRTIAVAMGMSLLSGFPETAYFNGLLALAWALLRGVQLPAQRRVAYAASVALGGVVAIAVASPQILSFFLYLRDSDIGGHAADFATARLDSLSILTTIIAPYLFGPPFAYATNWTPLYGLWAGIGGYASIALVVVALYGLLVRRDALAWLLLAWIIFAFGKTYAIEPILSVANAIPGMKEAVFARYGQPSWELALVVLAARGLDPLEREGARRGPWVLAATGGVGILMAGAVYGLQFWGQVSAVHGLRNWVVASALWAPASVAVVLYALRAAPGAAAARIATIFIVTEAAILCAIPVLSNPRKARIDAPAIEFLRANLGLQRFFTLGPIQPNYGALFGIASINHNYLPVPKVWTDHVRAELDRKWTDSVVFNGEAARNSPEEVRANLSGFERLAVKYIVADAGSQIFAGSDGIRKVYGDSLMDIFELAHPRPYLEDSSSRCTVEARDRTRVRARCESASRLIRRELFFPGWRARVNGTEVAIASHDTIFQSVELAAGESEIRFDYAPPHIGWAWLACFIGIAALATPRSLLLRRKHQ